MIQKKLLILGFGGHARSVADVALACGYTRLLFIDKNAQPSENFLGYEVVRSLSGLELEGYCAFAAAGDAKKRQQQCLVLENIGVPLVSLVAPSASIGVGSSVSTGCFVGHHAHVGPMAVVGKSVIINNGAVVEHESFVGDYSHISINASIAGRSKLGAYSMLGAGATIIDGLSVSSDVVIGAGSVVISGIDFPGTYVGIPAKKIG